MVNLKKQYNSIVREYEEFYLSKTNPEFILYKKYPDPKLLEKYMCQKGVFFLSEYGEFNILKLAELIKYLYQFKTDEEYKIYTIGTLEDKTVLDGDYIYHESIPHLHFVIGNKKINKELEEYNGLFINSKKAFYHLLLEFKGKNIISIDADSFKGKSINIECLTGVNNNETKINYFSPCDNLYMSTDFDLEKQIFSANILSKLKYAKNEYHINGMHNIFDFDIHLTNTFIANVLLSICIYKKNNDKQDLTNEDYNYIFNNLYNSNIDIESDISKDIPTSLTYVPHIAEKKRRKKR